MTIAGHRRAADESLVDRYVQGLLDANAAAQFEARLREDTGLRHLLEQTLAVTSGLHELGTIAPPMDFVAVAERQILRVGRRRFFPWWGWLLAPWPAVALLLFVLLQSDSWRHESAPGLATAAAATIVNIDGSAWGADGVPLMSSDVGRTLAPGGEVRTGARGAVSLAWSAGNVLSLSAESRLSWLGSAGRSGVVVRLEEGGLRLAVQRDSVSDVVVEIAGRRERVRMTSVSGAVSLLRRGDGRAVIACEGGTAAVEQQGSAVNVHAGYQLVLEHAGYRTRQTSRALQLQVLSASAGIAGRVDGSKTRHYRVRGRTEPGAVVAIGHQSVEVASDGSFEHEVAVAIGAAPTLRVRDVLQRHRSLELTSEMLEALTPGIKEQSLDENRRALPNVKAGGEATGTRWRWKND